jgi:hypothetical protein
VQILAAGRSADGRCICSKKDDRLRSESFGSESFEDFRAFRASATQAAGQVLSRQTNSLEFVFAEIGGEQNR